MRRAGHGSRAVSLVACTLCGLAAWGLAAGGLAAPNPASSLDPKQLEAAGYRVGEIRFEGTRIFDPSTEGVGRNLFGLMNRLHVDTHPAALRAMMVLQEGEPFEAWALEESERHLREFVGIRDARIRPVSVENGAVTLLVTWRENWTLSPQVEFSRAGGENRYEYGLVEQDLFGWAKAFGGEALKNGDSEGFRLLYGDPNLLLSRWRLRVEAEDTSDGQARRLFLTEPFFSLNDHHAFVLDASSARDHPEIYAGGEEAAEFPRSRDRVRVAYGFSGGRRQAWTRRWYLGAGWFQEGFAPDPSGGQAGRVPPEDHHLVYPYVRAEFVEDRYVTLRFVDYVSDEPEDFNLGWAGTAGLGLAQDGTALYDLSVGRGLRLPGDSVLLWRVLASGRVNGGPRDAFVGARALYIRPDPGGRSFLAFLRADAVARPDRDTQIFLDGRELRGHPNHRFGDEWLALLTLEERLAWRREILRFFWIQPAVFLDLGIAGPDSPARPLASLGFSLRVEPSRISRTTIFSLNFSYVLDDVEGAGRTEFDLLSGGALIRDRLDSAADTDRLP